MILRLTPSHLDEADLVRHLDGEGDATETRRRLDHLETCGRCRSELAGLREGSEAVSAWLEAAGFERAHGEAPPVAPVAGPRPRSGTVDGRPGLDGGPWLKAAILVLLVAAPLAAVPGVRGWVAERVGLADSGESMAVLSADRTASVADAGPAVVRFVPEAGSFHVAVAAEQAAGSLVLVRNDGTEAVLEVHGNRDDGGPMVSARGLRIENDPASTADYTLRLPGAVASVTVSLAEREVRIGTAELDGGVVVPLGRSAP